MSSVIEVSYGRSVFEVQVNFSQRKTLGISVLPNGSVVVSAPSGTSLDIISEKLKNRARWVKKQLSYFDQFHPRTPRRQFISGETHLYLGRQYRLRLLEAEKESIKLKGRFFLAAGPDLSSGTAKKLMEEWYKEKAQFVFEKHLTECMRKFPQFPKPALLVKPLKKRWGGLATDNLLTLNSDLVRANLECIDYVIVHELCHIEHPHHGPKFWQLLTLKFPQWKSAKHKLEATLK